MTDDSGAFYYLDHFHRALSWLRVSEHARGLWPEIDAFYDLPRPAQCLVVRLIMRQKAHFRRSKLAYPEIDDMGLAIDKAVAAGWLSLTHPLTLAEIGDLMTAPELRQCFGLPPGCRKGDALMLLQADAPEPRTFYQWWADSDDEVVTLLCRERIDRWRLAFFGNLHQQWHAFVLEEIGVRRYVPMQIDGAGFTSATEFEQCWAISQWDGSSELPATPAGPLAERRRRAAYFYRGREFERAGLFDEAIADYRLAAARVRLVRALELRGDVATAFRLARKVINRPRYSSEVNALEKALPRLAKATGIPWTRPARQVITVEALALTADPSRPVELLAAEALSLGNEQAVWVENSLFTGLFGLLFWDAIFAPVDSAFFHPFQSAPADLYAEGFESTRAELCAAAFAALENGQYRELISARFVDCHGLQNRFVQWDALSTGLIDCALRTIPAKDLSCIFRRMLDDLRHHRKGFPDQGVFNRAQPSYRLVEVKGPGDALQDHQRAWLHYFGRHGIDASVLKVSWA